MIFKDVDELNPSQSGILYGQCKGKCWVNTNKTLAVTYSYLVGGCGVFGEITDSVQDLNFLRKVFCDLKKSGIDEFEFSAEDEKLRCELLQLFANEYIESEMELSFRPADDYPVEDIQITGYDIVKVDRQFLAQAKHNCYQNYEGLIEKINESWQSYKDFLTKNRAFVVMKGNEIVGTILGSGRFKDVLAIYIEVEQEHRKKGLAKKLSCELIKECARCNIKLQWDCVESNKASIATAESLGFELFKKRPYYWFTI